MKWRQAAALLWKDVLVHGRKIGLFQLATVAGLFALTQMRERSVGDQAMAVLAPNVYMVTWWSPWLISREKTQRTFAWLRTLPIDDAVVVGEKFVAQALCCGPLWLLTSWLYARPLFWAPGVLVGVIVLLALLLVGGLSILARLVFTEKVGQVFPLAVIAGVAILAGTLLNNQPDLMRTALEFWNGRGGQASVAVTLLAAYLASYAATVGWISRAETPRLCE